MKKAMLVIVLVLLLSAAATTVAAAAVSNGNALTRLLSPGLQAVTVSSVVSIASPSPQVGAAYDSSLQDSSLAPKVFHEHVCHGGTSGASSDSSPSY